MFLMEWINITFILYMYVCMHVCVLRINIWPFSLLKLAENVFTKATAKTLTCSISLVNG